MKDLETDLETERFRNRCNVPHVVCALDGKHIAVKKPKKSDSEYFNYKGYFSVVLLALVDADYKFLCINMGASGSSSDTQIFNCSNDGKHITVKKPKKSGSECFNYNGYFSVVLLALVDADYKFLWVNGGGGGGQWVII